MKKSNQVLFETNMKKADTIQAGIIHSNNKDIIKITTGTVAHQDKSNEWLSEQLLLSFISTAFMRSLLLMAEQENTQIADFSCEAIADAVLANNIPEIVSINIYPKIYVEKQVMVKAVKKLVEATIKNSPIEKMFDATISYHPVIEIRSMADRLN